MGIIDHISYLLMSQRFLLVYAFRMTWSMTVFDKIYALITLWVVEVTTSGKTLYVLLKIYALIIL